MKERTLEVDFPCSIKSDFRLKPSVNDATIFLNIFSCTKLDTHSGLKSEKLGTFSPRFFKSYLLIYFFKAINPLKIRSSNS